MHAYHQNTTIFRHKVGVKMKKKLVIIFFISIISQIQSSDITNAAFGNIVDGMPAAFGDFNSDELTDLFVIRNSSTVGILLGSTKEPFFGYDNRLKCTLPSHFSILNVVPGDFDGDALMDVLIIAGNTSDKLYNNINYAFIEWGNITSLECNNEPWFKVWDEPLVIDYSKNMKADLFGINEKGERVLWIIKSRTEAAEVILLKIPPNITLGNLKLPSSHAFLDMNNDNSPDLCITSEKGYEIWLWDNKSEFVYNRTIPLPTGLNADKIGQTLLMDLETADKMNLVVPVFGNDNSSIFVYSEGVWFDLNVNFVQAPNKIWRFPNLDGRRYTDTVCLRAGDFNNDGYVDMLATLSLTSDSNIKKTFLFENVPCTNNCPQNRRTFEIQWEALSTLNDDTVMGTFYDFLQDGILDIIFVHLRNNRYKVSAFKNGLDYDANFIKVMVITGLTNNNIELPPTLLGTKRRTFGTNLPGPTIRYKTTTQDGNLQTGVAVQLPQSAHFALHLPYTIFGLGRTPNFVEDLTVGMFNKYKVWNQIIPNSQLVVVTNPPDEPSLWRTQLFVTPSKIVLQTVVALTGTCVVIGCLIAFLHWKERKEDRIEKLQEAHRFHFDAM